MKIKNFDVQELGNFLVDLKLKGQQSRMRTRFIKILQSHLDTINKEQDEIVKTYAELDENGKPKTRKEGNNEYYVIKEKEQAEKEINELREEEFVIEENEENKLMLLTVKEAVFSCEKEFQGVEAFRYDRYCELFENLSYETELAN